MAQKIKTITISGIKYDVEDAELVVVVHRAIPEKPQVGTTYFSTTALKYKDTSAGKANGYVSISEKNYPNGNLLTITSNILTDGILDKEKAENAIQPAPVNFCCKTTSSNFEVMFNKIVCVTNVNSNITDHYTYMEHKFTNSGTRKIKSYTPIFLRKTIIRRLKRAYGQLANNAYKAKRFMKPRKRKAIKDLSSCKCGMIIYGSVMRKHRMFINALSKVVLKRNSLLVNWKEQ